MVVVLAATLAGAAFADTIQLKDGNSEYGVIERMENGQVVIETATGLETVNLQDVASIDFNTPHLTSADAAEPLEHYLEEFRTPELTRLGEELNQTRTELRQMLTEIQQRWNDRDSVTVDELPQWNADRERFQAPLISYQELLNDFYLHVLAQVDDYNQLAEEAHEVYVGVRGVFRVGAPLVPGDQTELPMRRFLPRRWYDEIYFLGYSDGVKNTQALQLLTDQ